MCLLSQTFYLSMQLRVDLNLNSLSDFSLDIACTIGSFCQIPVRVYNISNGLPLCHLQDVAVIRNTDPFEGSRYKNRNADKSLEDLGIYVPTDVLRVDKCCLTNISNILH